MKLKDLIKGIEIENLLGDENKEICGISYDSRIVEKNFIFVCIKGFKADGHNYINEAVKNGAGVVVIEREISNSHELVEEKKITVIKVKDSRSVLSKLSSKFYNDPSGKLKVIGVTGTNGKTSITYLLTSILESYNVKCAIIGTICNKILGEEYETKNTTPESLELHKLFQDMVNKGVEVCAMEVSSHSLELKRVDNVQFNIGIFTNLTPEHLDYHTDMENYKKAKTKLFYNTSDVNIINTDDRYGKEIYEEIKGLNTPVITYGLSSSCHIYAKDIKMESTFSEFQLVTPKYSGKIKLKIPGLFSIYNILAVVSACYSLGYSFEQIKKGIDSINPVKGRFELIENDKGINVVIDYAHTPDALENVLETIKQFAKNNIIIVFGCGGDRDRTKRPLMGKIASELGDYCIITNDNPRTESPKQIISDILKGVSINNQNKCEVIYDRKVAIESAIMKAKKGDFILIAGKGHETYQVVGDKIYEFDDRKVAEEILGRINI